MTNGSKSYYFQGKKIVKRKKNGGQNLTGLAWMKFFFAAPNNTGSNNNRLDEEGNASCPLGIIVDSLWTSSRISPQIRNLQNCHSRDDSANHPELCMRVNCLIPFQTHVTMHIKLRHHEV
jgi:hypothetical protein